MKIQKILAIILTLCLILSGLVACDSGNASSTEQQTEDDKAQAQYECGKTAYDELVLAADLCEYMGSAIYDAWFFAIYKADYGNSDDADVALSDLASEVGISVADLKVGAEVVLGDFAKFVQIYLDDFEYTVDIVTAALEKNGTVDKLNTAISNAKTELKTMTNKYSDYSEYPTLKSMYSKVDSYATFVKNPSGSFEQLKSTIENYNNEIRTYKADLAFIFED